MITENEDVKFRCLYEYAADILKAGDQSSATCGVITGNFWGKLKGREYVLMDVEADVTKSEKRLNCLKTLVYNVGIVALVVLCMVAAFVEVAAIPVFIFAGVIFISTRIISKKEDQLRDKAAIQVALQIQKAIIEGKTPAFRFRGQDIAAQEDKEVWEDQALKDHAAVVVSIHMQDLERMAIAYPDGPQNRFIQATMVANRIPGYERYLP